MTLRRICSANAMAPRKIGVGQQNRKLFAAITHRQIGLAMATVLEHLGHFRQAMVPGHVPIGVVVALEKNRYRA
nr:hypothetical protein GCM10020185_04450 [Pseudomonas brassicacearum subsp. brassicacearum]